MNSNLRTLLNVDSYLRNHDKKYYDFLVKLARISNPALSKVVVDYPQVFAGLRTVSKLRSLGNKNANFAYANILQQIISKKMFSRGIPSRFEFDEDKQVLVLFFYPKNREKSYVEISKKKLASMHIVLSEMDKIALKSNISINKELEISYLDALLANDTAKAYLQKVSPNDVTLHLEAAINLLTVKAEDILAREADRKAKVAEITAFKQNNPAPKQPIDKRKAKKLVKNTKVEPVVVEPSAEEEISFDDLF